MSGTALAVAPLLAESYGFTTGVVESRLPSQRDDLADRIFLTGGEKQAALVDHVRSVHATGQPVLIGTASVARSEQLSAALGEVGIDSVVLNAKNDADEAAVIARAGEFGRVTVSTQMAGRGTDIRLGGVDEHDRERVERAGGLHVVGAEHYRTARLDDQLRGRAGRQGDPGSAVFFASLDDDVVVTNLELLSDEFAETAAAAFDALPRAVPFDARRLDRAAALLAHAQQVGEAAQEQQRATTVRFAEIPARQRSAVLELRTAVLDRGLLGDDGSSDDLRRSLFSADAEAAVADLLAEFGHDAVEAFCTRAALFHLDDGWRAHAAMLAEAREGIHLRSLARDNPLDAFVKIAQQEFESFVPQVRAALQSTVERARSEHDVAADALTFLRPGSTWTYMVTEDPFGSPEKRLWRRTSASLRRLLR
jgi:preprotein translocase subunit SecA